MARQVSRSRLVYFGFGGATTQEDNTRSNIPCILVGSTDSDTLAMLRWALGEYLPVETYPCENPAELAKSIAEQNPSLAVLDVAPQHLALCVGLIREVKASQSPPPVIAITSREEMCRATVEDAGADECVEKPFDIDVLVDAVKRHLK